MIGSISPFVAGNYYQGVNATNAAKKSAEESTETSADKNTGASNGLTDSQLFTQRHAGLSASDYISAYLDFAQQRSADLIKSGQATDTFSLRFEDRTYTLAGQKLGGLSFDAAKLSDALQVPVAQAGCVPEAPSAMAGRLDLFA